MSRLDIRAREKLEKNPINAIDDIKNSIYLICMTCLEELTIHGISGISHILVEGR